MIIWHIQLTQMCSLGSYPAEVRGGIAFLKIAIRMAILASSCDTGMASFRSLRNTASVVNHMCKDQGAQKIPGMSLPLLAVPGKRMHPMHRDLNVLEMSPPH